MQVWGRGRDCRGLRSDVEDLWVVARAGLGGGVAPRASVRRRGRESDRRRAQRVLGMELVVKGILSSSLSFVLSTVCFKLVWVVMFVAIRFLSQNR